MPPRKLIHLQSKPKRKCAMFWVAIVLPIAIAIYATVLPTTFLIISNLLKKSITPPPPPLPWSTHPIRAKHLPCHDLSLYQSTSLSVARMTQAQYDVVHANAKLCSPILITDALNTWDSLIKWDKYYFQEYYGEERGAATGKFGQDDPDNFAMPIQLFAEHVHEGSPTSWTYLQDELFISSHPELLLDITPIPTPLHYSWFRYLPSSLQPPDAFLLWGTAHSRSTLHVDPYNWTGTNALIRGTKEWIFVPPGQGGPNDQWLYPLDGARCGFPLDCFKYNSRVDAFATNALQEFPLFASATVIKTTQHEGELMMIPPGWYHQVKNPSESIAVASQIWSDDHFEISMEEIIKLKGNVGGDSGGMPSKNERASMTHAQQFQALLAAIPKRVEREAKATLKDAKEQINQINRKSNGGKKKTKKKN